MALNKVRKSRAAEAGLGGEDSVMLETRESS